MKRWRTIIIGLLAAVCLLGLAGCEKPEAYDTYNFYAMDTLMSLKIRHTAGGETLLKACEAQVRDLETLLSRTVENGETAALNQPVTVLIGADTRLCDLVTRASRLTEQTGGAFDVTIGRVVSLWDTSTAAGRLPSQREIQDSLLTVGASRLTCRDGNLYKETAETQVDFGAIGKGYAADRLVSYLQEQGVSGGVLSLGGNVAVFGEKADGDAYHIGVRDPENAGQTVGTVALTAGYVSVSGHDERYYEVEGNRYSHILNPVTGMPPEGDLLSAAVICEDGTDADALSTALYVMGREQAMAFYRDNPGWFEAILITGDGLYVSEGLRDRFTPAEGNTVCAYY